MQTQLSNVRVAYHRNGISGWPFWVVLFDWVDGAGLERHMVATVAEASDFRGEGLWRRDCIVSVLDVGLLAAGVIAFRENSWRGDDFAGALWAEIDLVKAAA